MRDLVTGDDDGGEFVAAEILYLIDEEPVALSVLGVTPSALATTRTAISPASLVRASAICWPFSGGRPRWRPAALAATMPCRWRSRDQLAADR